ncbi:MAG: PAS domain S-box protein [Chitinophagales bacterium]|nr:PAS domain S-box protein [Chitinophagales bacterium]
MNKNIKKFSDDLITFTETHNLGVIFLTSKLNIHRTTPLVQHYLSLPDNCIGLNISEIKDIDPLIIELVQNAGQTLSPVKYTISDTQIGEYFVEIHHIGNQKDTQSGIMLTFSKSTNNDNLNYRLGLMAQALQDQGVKFLKTIIKENQTVSDLAQQKDMFESILANMTEAIVVINDHGCIEMHNQAAEQISPLIKAGLPLAEWIEEYNFHVPFSDRIDIPKEQNPFFKALQGKEGKNWELYMVKKGNQNGGIYLNISVQNLKANLFNNGSIIVMYDITSRKQSEIELLNSELTKRALLYAIPDILFRVNREGVYLDYIPAKDAKIPSSAFVSNNIIDVLPSDIADEILHYIEQALDTGAPQTFTFEHTYQDKINHYEARIAPIDQNEVMGIVRDVTDQIESEHTVKKTNENYRKLIELNPAPLALLKSKGEIIFINKSARKMLHISENADLTDKTVLDFVQKGQLLTVKTAVSQIMRGDYFERSNIFKMVTTDGKHIDVEANGSVITYNYELVVQVAMQDVTQTKRSNQKNRNSNQLSNNLLDSTTNSIFFFDSNKNIILDCNSNMVELLGFNSKEDIASKSIFTFSPNIQPNGVLSKNTFHKIFEELTLKTKPICLFWQFSKKSGGLVDTEITLIPSEKGSKNKWMAVVMLNT